MRNIITIIFMTFVVLNTGCYDDEGSNKYKDIGVFEISNIDAKYSAVSYEDTLKLRPEVGFTGPAADMEYLWTIYPKTSPAAGVKVEVDTIGQEKNLDFPVDLPQGAFIIRLNVKNTDTDYMAYAETELQTSTLFSQGFYLLKETNNGNSELDFCMPDNTLLPDMMERSVGSVIEGKPSRLGLYFIYSYWDEETQDYGYGTTLMAMSEQDARTLRLMDMSEIYNHETMFYGDEPDETPLMVYVGTFGAGYISNKGCYFTSQMPAYGSYSTGRYGFPSNAQGGMSVNKHVIMADDMPYFYDEQNGRFLMADWNNTVQEFTSTNGNLPYGIAHKLLYYGKNTIGWDTKGYAIFQDETDPGKRYLYTQVIEMMNYHDPIESIGVIDPALNFNSATLMAVNANEARIIYGVVGDAVYAYDVDAGTEQKLIFQGMGNGEEITYLAHKYWTNGEDAANNFDCIIVATHKDGKYKVYFYNKLGGIPQGSPIRVIEGDGKVRDLQYISPLMGSSFDSYYYAI